MNFILYVLIWNTEKIKKGRDSSSFKGESGGQGRDNAIKGNQGKIVETDTSPQCLHCLNICSRPGLEISTPCQGPSLDARARG